MATGTPISLPVWQSPHPRLHRGKPSTSSRHQTGTSPSPITANIQVLPSTLYSAGPLKALVHSCLGISVGREILILLSGASLQHCWRVYTSSLSMPGDCIRFRGLLSRLERLLLSVTAMPIFGNRQIDDPSRAGVAGRTCNLQTGVYLSGCLRDLVPLRGKGTRDRLPGGISVDSGEGISHSSVGSSSGSAR